MCTTPRIIADTSLFNAARRNLGTNAATFGNLEGTGKAENRVFRIKIDIGMRENKACSALTLFQVEGGTAEPIHPLETPLYDATPRLPDPTSPRLFSLQFGGEAELPPFIAALSDGNEMTFRAPNRMARESFLLTLGIAGFRGRPADLSVDSDLFPCEVKEDVCVMEEAVEEEGMVDVTLTEEGKMAALEKEIVLLRNQLTSKNDAIVQAEANAWKSQEYIDRLKAILEREKEETRRAKEDYKGCYTQLRLAEKRIQTFDETMSRTKNDFNLKLASMDDDLAKERGRNASLEKTIKSLQNQNAVWEASVKSRDDKLIHMEQIKLQLKQLTEQCKQSETIKHQLEELTIKHTQLQKEHIATQSQITDHQTSLQTKTSRILTLESEQAQSQIKIDTLQKKLHLATNEKHQLMSDRNNFKKKSDSLSKEMTRVVAHEQQKNTTEINTLQSEIEYLKYTKKKALEELTEERHKCERLQEGLRRNGKEEEWRVMEQRVELERVVKELTEYVEAKERQIETMRQVNQALVEDCRMLAEKQRGAGDI